MSKKVSTDDEIVIDETLAKKIASLCNKGLCMGLGVARPGAMCIEAAVNYAMGRPHNDRPVCVDGALRDFKIDLNDSLDFASNKARGKALKRLGIAQLGTYGDDYVFDSSKFEELVHAVVQKHIDKHVKGLIKANSAAEQTLVSSMVKQIQKADFDDLDNLLYSLRDNLADFEPLEDSNGDVIDPSGETPVEASYYNLTDQINWITRDMATKEKAAFLYKLCEEFVKILVKLKTPGSKFLHLAPFEG